MTSKTKNQPAATLRDGALKATIWANPGKNGKTRYSIDLARSYTDESGAWKDTTHFSPNELLRVARLAGKAYDEVATIRSSETNPAGGSQ